MSSMYCSSIFVPSVVVTIACVSPRVKSAEPWTRGSQPTSHVDRADLGEFTSVRTAAFAEHILAEDLFLQVRKHLSGHCAGFRLIFGIAFDNLFFQRVDRRITRNFVLTGRIQRFAQLVTVILFDFGDNGLVQRRRLIRTLL